MPDDNKATVSLDFSKAQPIAPPTMPALPQQNTPAPSQPPVKLDFNNAVPVESQKPPEDWSQTEKAIVPAWGGGFISIDVPKGTARQYEAAHLRGYEEGGKLGLSMLGAAAAPEFLPELAGGGLLGYLGRLFLRSSVAGIGAGVGNAAGQLATGQNPVSGENLRETGRVAATTAALSAPLEAIGQLPFSKFGRSAINQSLSAQARDVTYGNPAVALTKEGIDSVSTGDWQMYRNALNAGKSPLEAAQAAGGRFAAVNQRIAEISPQLDRVLSASQAQIPVAEAIDKPLNSAALDIIANPAMTDMEKDAALTQLGGLQKAVKTGLGSTATPSQLQAIKQAVGNRVNWGGNIAVSDEVRPAYRQLYGSLKDSINAAVPESASLNERLSNLLSAHADLDNLAKMEEVGRGGGPLSGGKIGSTVVGLAERSLGRVLPAATNLSNNPMLTGARAGLAAPLSDFLKKQQ